MTSPSRVNIEPWHGQSHVPSALFHVTNATEVRARGGQCVRRAVVFLPYGDLLLAALDHATAAGFDLVERVDDRFPRRAGES